MSVTQAIISLLMGLKLTDREHSRPANHRRVFREFGAHLERIAMRPEPAGRRKKSQCGRTRRHA
ncbi:MAG: hypothetical protein K8F25_05500 [Fimbriimonadaceae bacterium]|nr:hypothetical protein [Alphaproteobacteria bacterium]